MSSAVASPVGNEYATPAGWGPRPIVPVAVSLFAQAKRSLTDARCADDSIERFTTAYAAALRAAAAVLAARGRRHRGRSRPTSVWTLLESTVPDMHEWAGFFAAHSDIHAAAQAGITRRMSEEAADELLQYTGLFLEYAERVVGGKR